jgi:alpha-tubulin suppressor-like RCC1 family protein
MDLDTLDNSKLKLKENLNTLLNFKENKKSPNILLLLQLKDEFDIVSEEIINEIYSFGWNHCGQLGLGNTIDQSTPQLISTLKNEKIKNVVCGNHYSIIITGNLNFIEETENGVYSFGRNSYGQLGLGNTVDQTTPQLISTLKNKKIKNAVCGGQHTFIF